VLVDFSYIVIDDSMTLDIHSTCQIIIQCLLQDFPAEDVGVGPREMGYLFGQYRRLSGHFQVQWSY
jgi:hypothetical protein